MHIQRINRKPPAWRDPEYPDVELGGPWGSVYSLWAVNDLQQQRGLPEIENLMRPYHGRPSMRLSWWDKKQKKVRGVDIWADIVMSPRQWNHLHPEARRLVPHRLLPQEALGIHLLEPTPART